MLKQYSVVSKCLAELKTSDLPVIEKLKLEVQLIQTKRILLDYKVEQRVSGQARSEQEFNDLFDQIRHVCTSRGGTGELDQVKQFIAEIKDGLSIEPYGKVSKFGSALQIADGARSAGAVRNALPSVREIFKTSSELFPDRSRH